MSPGLGHYLLVFIGGGIGSCLRHGVNLWALARFGPGFPAGTLTVNVVGSAVMGVLAALLLTRTAAPEWRLLLMTGVLGGFTTFSAFSLDVWGLWERGAPGTAFAYAAGSVVLSIAALVSGLLTTRALIGG